LLGVNGCLSRKFCVACESEMVHATLQRKVKHNNSKIDNCKEGAF